jgi:hypothetical protein
LSDYSFDKIFFLPFYYYLDVFNLFNRLLPEQNLFQFVSKEFIISISFIFLWDLASAIGRWFFSHRLIWNAVHDIIFVDIGSVDESHELDANNRRDTEIKLG